MPSLFSALTSKIFGGLSIALLIVVGALWFQNARLTDQRDTARDKLTAEVAAHKVTLESVATLRDALDAKNAESLARAAALETARQESAQAQADADRRFRSTQSRIDALRAAVGQNGDDCSIPEEVTDALAGL
jgi:chromosome segregation ATPase